ncbi:MAG TPA: PAS domain-containing protein [Longimicrobium sp.]|nr:PAS domain-containing protein [Longimicrobium sp.]
MKTPVRGSTTAPPARLIFPGESEMARLCRGMDWAATSLGAIEAWPQSLKTAAGMVIAQGIAQSLCWGPRLVQVYNDEYRVIMGDKHPDGLGRPLFDNWPEIREDIGPLVQRVLGGETVFFEDLLLRVERHGAAEDAWFTFSYSPVRVESGEVGGLLINCFETTRQVQARAVQAERDRLFESLAFERSRLEYVFQHAPAFLAVLRGPTHVFEIANEAYYRLVGRRDILGKPALDALPEVRNQGFDALLDNVLRTGEPFIGRELPLRIARTPGADPEEVYVDFAYLPLVEADGTRSGVIAHGHDVTGQVLARRQVELLLRESEEARQRLRQANAALEAQQAEMEAVNQQLQENALELEMQTEELQRTAAALEERTQDAEAARAQAERAREHLERLVHQAPVAMYIALGREHVFDIVNAPYYAMVGKRPDEMLGRPGREVFPELVPQGVFDIIEQVYDTGVAYRAPAIPAVFDTDGDGSPRTHHFNLVYQPLLDARGAVYAIALVATEVTELVAAREAADAARQEAELANRAKADFLASMSHELRTPLNAIGGYVDLVEMGIHGPVTPAQREALGRVKVSQQHLLTLINDVLTFARVEAGRIDLDLQEHSASGLLATIEPLVAPLAEARQIVLSVGDCDPSLRLVADAERTRQILLNLVGNAIKFTQPLGRVRLTCQERDGWADIRVSDNGPGIAPEKQQSIFDPFVQVERRFSNPREGVGLGLSISRDLARAMGGELSVASVPGEGSTFTLLLPRAHPG